MSYETDFVDVYLKLESQLRKEITNSYKTDNYEVLSYDDIDENYEYEMIECFGEDILNSFNESKIDYYRNSNKEQIVTFDIQTYFKNILLSYKYKRRNIKRQFELDFPRNTIYVNDTKMEKKDFKKYLRKYKGKIVSKYKSRDYTLDIILTMLCNQSSYGFPYFIMHQIYGDLDKSILVASLSTNRCIKFKIKNNDVLKISVCADFGLRNLSTNSNIKIIKTKVIIEINLNNGDLNMLNKYGFLKWQIK